MPKTSKPVTGKIKDLAREFKNDMLESENRDNSRSAWLMCRCCGVRVGSDDMKRSAVLQHINTAKHSRNKALYSKQQTLKFEKDTFYGDVCQVRENLSAHVS